MTDNLAEVLRNVRDDIVNVGEVVWRANQPETTFDYITRALGESLTWDEYEKTRASKLVEYDELVGRLRKILEHYESVNQSYEANHATKARGDGVEKLDRPVFQDEEDTLRQAIARLQAPSNQWNFDMSLVPKGEDDMVLLLFNSASVPVVKLCWWNDDEDDGWSIGWYSSKHSVTTEKVADYLGEPIGWCDTPDELYEACN